MNDGFNDVYDTTISFLLGFAIAVKARSDISISSMQAAHDYSAVSFNHLLLCSISLLNSAIGLPSAHVIYTIALPISFASCNNYPTKAVVKLCFRHDILF